jgi:hypothetical protein
LMKMKTPVGESWRGFLLWGVVETNGNAL